MTKIIKNPADFCGIAPVPPSRLTFSLKLCVVYILACLEEYVYSYFLILDKPENHFQRVLVEAMYNVYSSVLGRVYISEAKYSIYVGHHTGTCTILV